MSQKYYEYKGVKLSHGRYEFNKCLPEDYEVIDKQIDKKTLSDVLNHIALNYPTDVTMTVLDNIKKLGFEISTKEGFTLSLKDLYQEEFEKFTHTLEDDITKIDKNLKKINDNKKIQEKLKKLPFYVYIKSGARGSIEQLKQMIVSRGYVADSNNKIVPKLIRSNLVCGLNEEEFFTSSYGTRKGLLDTALTVSQSGYLSRQLIYSTINMELDEKLEDCKSEDYLTLFIGIKDNLGELDLELSEKIAKSFLWRYFIGPDGKKHLITTKNYKELIGKKINLRSPIYCNGKKICKTCYGNMAKSNILHSDQIGLIASQALSEVSTQLLLRSFHTGGLFLGSTNADENENDDMVSSLNVINKIFHNPESINIKTPQDMIFMLQNVFGKYSNIHNVHYEVITSAMMWSKDSIWRTIPNRSNVAFNWESILQIPSKSSWLIGASFSRLKSKLLEGLIHDRIDTPSSLSSLFRY